MNDLNSVIIVGKTTKKYKTLDNNSVEFSIDVSRTYLNDGKLCKEISNFDIFCIDSLAKKIQKIPKRHFANQIVQITGRLRSTKWKTKKRVYIFAENINFQNVIKGFYNESL